jgi:pimeloyl-[acyl-carrier protein] synthase
MTIQAGTMSLADEVAEFYTASGDYDPTSLYQRLLAEEPVHRTVYGFWVVAGYDDAITLLKSDKAMRTAPPLAHEGSAEDELNRHFLSRKEEPDHGRLRGIVQKTFSPRSVQVFIDMIESTVREVIQRARETGEFDMAQDIARPLPLALLCRIFDIPLEDRDVMSDGLADLILAYRPAGSPEGAAEAAEHGAAVVSERIRAMMEHRRHHLGDDLLSVMLKAQADGAEISDPEILSIVAHLLQAGTQTTRILLTNGLLTLLQHPAQLARLRADDTLIKPAVEECLRWITPARTLAQRLAVEDIELSGTVIPKGDELAVWVGAANRDPRVFTNPDTFDITRTPNPHLAFSTGTHYCLGVNLAKLEGNVVFRVLLDELPELEYSESELVWGESPMRPLITSMPVRVR